MKAEEWLDKVAYLGKSDIEDDDADVYLSIFDDSYITRVGMEDTVQHLADREITEGLTQGVGYSPLLGKWFGWSHRAIYGFHVGSECKKGDVHYEGSTLQEQETSAIEFWHSENHIRTWCVGVIESDGKRYFDIKWEYDDKVPNEKLRNNINGVLHLIKPLGKGEWSAKTMSDAKQMAVDFNEGVS